MSTELAQLFAKAAEDYDPADLAAIVKAMRELRAQFELGLKAPAAERPPRKKKEPVDKGDIDLLKDLDLDLHSPSEISTIIEGLGQKGRRVT